MRIGINVPNDLLKRVKTLQPDVNVSQVCREALEQLAARQERAVDWLATDGSVERVLEFAESRERFLQGPDWESYGLDDAREWMETITPEAWDRFLYLYHFLESKGRNDFEMLVGGTHPHYAVKGFHYHEQENMKWRESMYDYEDNHGIGTGFMTEAKQRYEKAWLAYVKEIRRKFLEHSQAKGEKLQAEREKAWQARPAPLLPPQLLP